MRALKGSLESLMGSGLAWKITKGVTTLFNVRGTVHLVRIEDKDEKGEGYLVVETKEDLEEFKKMLIEAYYELNPA